MRAEAGILKKILAAISLLIPALFRGDRIGSTCFSAGRPVLAIMWHGTTDGFGIPSGASSTAARMWLRGRRDDWMFLLAVPTTFYITGDSRPVGVHGRASATL